MKYVLQILIFVLTFGVSFGFAAEEYPVRPIRFICAFPPGGGTDIFARLVVAKLPAMLGQQIIIDNRSGAQGSIGTALAARATPDGYTGYVAHQGAMTINPHLYKDVGYDTLRDFAGVSIGTATASILTVHPSLPVKTLKELIEYARQHPEKMTLASTSSGQQVKQGILMRLVGKKLLSVAYPGASPAVIDLVQGQVNLMTSNATSVIQYIKAGKVRPIAFLGDKRVPVLPDVPSAVEAGYPMLDLKEWFGFAMPAKTPRSIIAKLNQNIVSALKSPDVIEKLGSMGQTATFTTPEEMDKQIREEYELFGSIIRELGLKIE